MNNHNCDGPPCWCAAHRKKLKATVAVLLPLTVAVEEHAKGYIDKCGVPVITGVWGLAELKDDRYEFATIISLN